MKVIPLVSWLWIGGLVVGLGAVIAALPPSRRRTAIVAGAVPVGSTAGAK